MVLKLLSLIFSLINSQLLQLKISESALQNQNRIILDWTMIYPLDRFVWFEPVDSVSKNAIHHLSRLISYRLHYKHFSIFESEWETGQLHQIFVLKFCNSKNLFVWYRKRRERETHISFSIKTKKFSNSNRNRRNLPIFKFHCYLNFRCR